MRFSKIAAAIGSIFGIAQFYGATLLTGLFQPDGSVDWSGTWRQGREGGSLQAEAGLQGLKVALPAPLDRPEGLAQDGCGQVGAFGGGHDSSVGCFGT